MPELPEVESSVNFLKRKVLKRTFVDIWRGVSKMGVCKGSLNKKFEKELTGRKIKRVKRRAKNIIFDLDDNFSLLVHYKMTGHLLYGRWKRDGDEWVAEREGPLKEDKMNRYIRFLFFLSNGKQIAFSDLRKFGKIELWKSKELEKKLSQLGPEPLENDFTLDKFKKMVSNRKKMIKPLVMDQHFLAGIGNIYASDALWIAKIHPKTKAVELTKKEVKQLYKAIKSVLKEGIENCGDSMVDFRLPDGTKGNYQNKQKVYNREGEVCNRCEKEKIKKIKVSGRGTYFCPHCQEKK